MKTITDVVPLATNLVKELSTQINTGQTSLIKVEDILVDFINQFGHLLFSDIMHNVDEPVFENTLIVNDKKAYYQGQTNLHFIDRFGYEIIKPRRGYNFGEGGGGYYPLDEKLGMDKCRRFSPLMTYLQSFFGGAEPYASGAKKLSKALGFKISATAVQNNTEMTGKRLEGNPIHAIPVNKENEGCDVMIAEIDGTMSPQIAPIEGVVGQESLKQPTEYKECNIIAIQKFERYGKGLNKKDEWVGGTYGPRKDFENYTRQTGIKMGQMKAKEIVFIADGAKHNWEIQMNTFPDAIPILDFYHASEHLMDFCEFFKKPEQGKKQYRTWNSMLYEGETLQVLSEMRKALDDKITNRNEALKHYNYFENNKERMHYLTYRERGYPIGSGLIEGKCKLIVCRRFKGNGMRWKKNDNDAVLKVRLAFFNGTLARAFKPEPRAYQFASGL